LDTPFRLSFYDNSIESCPLAMNRPETPYVGFSKKPSEGERATTWCLEELGTPDAL